MKSFSAISLLLLLLLFGSRTAEAADVTWTYNGPPFSLTDCEAVGYPAAQCAAGGAISATVTFSDSLLVAGTGFVDGTQITSWSMSAGSLGSAGSGGSGASLTAGISFSGGQPTSWHLVTFSTVSGQPLNIDTYWVGGAGRDAGLLGSLDTVASTLGFVFTPPSGAWSGGSGSGDSGGGGSAMANKGKEQGGGPCAGQNSGNTGQIWEGNPCNVGTGNKFQSVTDYTTSGQHPLSFTRYYNSLPPDIATFATELGSRWRSTYDRYLHISSGTVTAERADGQMLNFTANGSNWTSDSDVDVRLVNTGMTWLLTDHNDTVETYAQMGSGKAVLISIVTRDGYTQTLTYNSGNQLIAVTDSYGRALAFAYAGNLLAQVTTPDALVLAYGYTSSGLTPGVNDQLASVAYSTTPVTKQVYTYINNFDLASITDENGAVFASWTYDAQDRATSSQHGVGAEKVVISYDTDTQRTVTNALGEQTVYTFTQLQGVPKITGIARTASATVPTGTEAFTYDANGYTASKTDWNGNVTQYVNDIHGDPVSITEAAGTSSARTTVIAYHASLQHLPIEITAPRKTTSFVYDLLGNILTRIETDTSVAGGQVRNWEFTYDATGHVLTAANPLGAVTTYSYTGNNIATVTDALGHVSRVTSYNNSGQPLSMTDPNGVVTTLAYDVRNRLTSRKVDGATTSFAYDAAGNLTTMTLPDGAQLLYMYDTAHRVTQVKNNLGEAINYTLDANDDITQQQISGTTIVKTQTAVFDTLGRMLQQIGAYNETTGLYL